MRSKKIIVKNKKDYKRFIKNIKIYKTILYHNIYFYLEDNDNEELNNIITALNIKDRYNRIVFVYNKACEYIDNNLNYNDICDFKCNKCIYQREHNNNSNGCCRTCKYLKNGKCSTKNLACKLFYCPSIRKNNKILRIKDINILKLFSLKNKILLKTEFFRSYEDVLNDLKSRSLLKFILKSEKNKKSN